jgi:hypothetical protein
MSRLKPRPDGPFWPVNEPAHRARIVEALINDPRVALDRQAAEALAGQTTTRAADLLMRGGGLRDSLFRTHQLPDGEWVRTIKLRTTLDVPWWHNLRIEMHWADASASARPWPTVRGTASEPVTALHTACDSQEQAVELVRNASAFLDEESTDLKRGYPLRDDLARNGQERAGIAVLHDLSWPDAASGATRTRTVLARVLGNSRAAARLSLLRLNAVDAVFGVPLRLLRGAPPGAERANEKVDGAPAVLDDPATGWNHLMAAYELAADAERGEAVLPDGHERLAEVDLAAVQRMADVTTEVVVAVSDPSRLLELTQKANIRDHLRGNQELTDVARLLALGAEILDVHRMRGTLMPEEVTVLYGVTPPTALDPQGRPVVAEAARRARLLELVFPADEAASRAVGGVMGEPTNRAKVTGPQMQQRGRVFTALATRGQHNPRAGEAILDRNGGLTGVRLPAGLVTDWMQAATVDPHGAEAQALLGPLAVPWLVEAELYGAPRGSDPQGRRTAADVIAALRARPVQGVGLMRELLFARAADTVARQVDVAGDGISDTAVSRTWFDAAFPPTRRRTPPPPPPPPVPRPPPTPEALLDAAQLALLTTIADASGHATELANAVDQIVALCGEHDLAVTDQWHRDARAAFDAMLNDLDRRPDFSRLRRLVES